VTPDELRYLAGIIDGEGCISLHSRGERDRGYVTPGLQVGNTDKRLSEWLQQHVVEGHVYENKDGRARHRRVWLWAVYGDIARRVIREVEPYLILKGEQARLVLTVEPLKAGRRLSDDDRASRLSALDAIRALNQRGPSAQLRFA
jgi:hypothetical protein